MMNRIGRGRAIESMMESTQVMRFGRSRNPPSGNRSAPVVFTRYKIRAKARPKKRRTRSEPDKLATFMVYKERPVPCNRQFDDDEQFRRPTGRSDSSHFAARDQHF